MVCIYCGSQTRVTNSRLQKRTNTTWRRRHCVRCDATFTSLEQVASDKALTVQSGTSHIIPFDRDLLFLSIYDACRHRKDAVSDASALANTVISNLWALRPATGIVQRDTIVKLVSASLNSFDRSACVHYLAFHPLALRKI